MIEALILVIGLPLAAWLIRHFMRLSFKAVEYFEGRSKRP